MDINGNTHKNCLTLGSLFSGSGGFELGGLLAGITPVFNCEIEPFPIRVTTKRLPQVKHYGDISSLHGADLPPVDIITGGFPCQSVSIAGKREGVQHIDHGGDKTTRSGLFYEAVRIIKEMRRATNGEKPRFFVVENVPGLFSSKAGEDFKAVLDEIIAVAEPEAPPLPMPEKGKWAAADVILGDGWSVAYRTLDAQYFGVAQRRKRLFLVADFAGQSAPKVLFESEGVSGYSAEGFRAWQRAAPGTESGAGTAGGCGGSICLNDQGGVCMDVSENVTGTLRAQEHGHQPCVMEAGLLEAAGFCTEHSANARSIGYEEERSPTLRAGVVPAAIALENHPTDSRVKIAEDGVVQTLPARMGTGGGNVPLLMEQDTLMEQDAPVTLKIRSGREGGGKGPIWQEDKSATLGCNNDQTVFVPFVKGTRPHSPGEAPTWKHGETANTINTYDVGEQRCNELAVKAYGICSKGSHAMQSDNPHSGFYEAQTSRTLDGNGGNPTCAQGGVAICQPVVCADQGGGKSNCTVDELVVPPLACTHGGAPAVAFTQNQRNEVRDLGDNSGALAAEPGAEQQTYVLQGSMIGRGEENGPQGDGVNVDVSFTLDATDRHAVCAPEPDASEPNTSQAGVYAMTTGSYMQVEKEVSPTLMARDFKDPTSIAPVPQAVNYTVRRLTPTECARLQGFPDDWCHGLGTADPTKEDIAFWTDVFETHRRLVTHAAKPKTEKQIRKWLADPYSDAAEYKLWGNGVALPCVYFVLAGIIWASALEA